MTTRRQGRLLRLLDNGYSWDLLYGPHEFGGQVNPGVPKLSYEQLRDAWTAAVAAARAGTASEEVLGIVEAPDCWARREFGQVAA
jgi:hypothetical protein